MFEDVITRQTKLCGRILRALVSGSKSVSEIAAALRVDKGGDISDALEQLAESGMVARDGGANPATGAAARECPYRLKDNYSRFYLKYVEPSADAIDADSFAFAGLEQFPGWETDMGLQFENLVLNNFRELLAPLLTERETLLANGEAIWHPDKSWRRECRLFADRQQSGTISVKTSFAAYPGFAGRLQVKGLDGATLRFFPPLGFAAGAPASALPELVHSDWNLLAEPIAPEWEETPDGPCAVWRNVTGPVFIAW